MQSIQSINRATGSTVDKLMRAGLVKLNNNGYMAGRRGVAGGLTVTTVSSGYPGDQHEKGRHLQSRHPDERDSMMG